MGWGYSLLDPHSKAGRGIQDFYFCGKNREKSSIGGKAQDFNQAPCRKAKAREETEIQWGCHQCLIKTGWHVGILPSSQESSWTTPYAPSSNWIRISPVCLWSRNLKWKHSSDGRKHHKYSGGEGNVSEQNNSFLRWSCKTKLQNTWRS